MERSIEEAIAEARASLAELRGVIDDMQEQTAIADREQTEYLNEADKQLKERAKAARAGELGPEWRRLQERIDREETGYLEIASGMDESPDARRAVAAAYVQADRVAELQQAAEAEGDEELPVIAIKGEPQGQLRGLDAETRAAMAEAKRTQAEVQASMQRIREIPIPNPD